MQIELSDATVITLLFSNLYFIYLLAKRNSKAMEQHAHLIDRIRDIIKTDITDIQILKIIEAVTAFNHRPHETPPDRPSTWRNDFMTMVTVAQADGSPLKINIAEYVQAKTKHLAYLRKIHPTQFPPTMLQVREALENVLNGMVHDELEHDISKDIIQ